MTTLIVQLPAESARELEIALALFRADMVALGNAGYRESFIARCAVPQIASVQDSVISQNELFLEMLSHGYSRFVAWNELEREVITEAVYFHAASEDGGEKARALREDLDAANWRTPEELAAIDHVQNL